MNHRIIYEKIVPAKPMRTARPPAIIHFFPNSLSLSLKTKYINEAQIGLKKDKININPLNTLFSDHTIFSNSIFNSYTYKCD